MTAFAVATIALALAFDYINGFHDAANSIATVVSTRVLSPRAAVAWAAAFNFIAFMFFHPRVAASIARGVDPSVVTTGVIFATLTGAIVWNLVTWYVGLPSSSSHALLGSLAGAGLVRASQLRSLPIDPGHPHGALWPLDAGVYVKTAVFIVASPVLGALLGFLAMKAIRVLAADWTPARVEARFRRLQLVSAALYSLGHGGNDAQKTMGIIMALLVAGHGVHGPVTPRLWVVLACHGAMGLGTLTGGWRIVRTMGMKITRLRPVGGFCAESAGAATLFMATALGIPVSTTHTITGSIVGVGAATGRLSAVRWGVAGRIVWAWVFTIPASAALASVAYVLVRSIAGHP